MALFDRFVNRISTTDKGKVVPATKRQIRFGNLGVASTTHERDQYAVWKLSIEIFDSFPDEILGRHLDLLNIACPAEFSHPFREGWPLNRVVHRLRDRFVGRDRAYAQLLERRGVPRRVHSSDNRLYLEVRFRELGDEQIRVVVTNRRGNDFGVLRAGRLENVKVSSVSMVDGEASVPCCLDLTLLLIDRVATSDCLLMS